MLINKNDDIRLRIDALTNLGSGIGRYKDMAVFVDGTAVGDEIIAHIIKVKKNFPVIPREWVDYKDWKPSPDSIFRRAF